MAVNDVFMSPFNFTMLADKLCDAMLRFWFREGGTGGEKNVFVLESYSM